MVVVVGGSSLCVCKLECCVDVAVSAATAVGHIWDLPHLSAGSLWRSRCWGSAVNRLKMLRVTLLARPALRSRTPLKTPKYKPQDICDLQFSLVEFILHHAFLFFWKTDTTDRSPASFLQPSVCCSLTSQMLCISSYLAFPLSNANPEGTAWQ